MKQIYCCEICGAGFETEEECNQCERSHIGLRSIEAAMFRKNSRYADNVLIRMDDGGMARYIFDQVLMDEPEISPQPVRFQLSGVDES